MILWDSVYEWAKCLVGMIKPSNCQDVRLCLVLIQTVYSFARPTINDVRTLERAWRVLGYKTAYFYDGPMDQ